VPRVPSEPVVGYLAAVWSSIAAGLADLPPDAWDRSTECVGWAARDHLAHLVGTELELVGASRPAFAGPVPEYVHNPIGEGNEAWVAARRTVPGGDLLGEFVAVTDRRLAQLRSFEPEDFDRIGWSPIGDVPYRAFMEIRVFDCWVHEQDIRRAVDRPGGRGGPGEEISVGRIEASLPYVVGRQVRAPAGTTVVWRLSGPFVRQIAVGTDGTRARPLDTLVEQPDVTLELDCEMLVRLGCGRIDPDAAIDQGDVALGGDESLGQRIVAAMNVMI
jgi:uncharacterized protein (TIGR03083 family)